ncbi:MAG: TonB-dependent receptor [Ignavibacteriae bacterium]|nr:TonB-dependent receptor [Ignavibacteriota bacterium]
MKNNFNRSIFSFILSLGVSLQAFAFGQLSGKIVDAQSGEVLIGANILIKNTNIGASTDLDGRYKIKNLSPGYYTIVYSFISYSTVTKSNILIKDNETTIVDIALSQEALVINEVVVTEKADLSFEGALLNKQKNSSVISDGLSAELISKSPDASTADALKRVSGITLMDNKFVYVRGTSERYSNAMLNDAQLPATEVDKKSFAFDLIPSGIIENTIVIKTFTPDQPGEFGGGLVKVNTIEFPNNRSISINYSLGYTKGVTNQDFLTYHGGAYDWLGFDDGIRTLPNNFPKDFSQLDLFNSEQRQDYYEAVNSLNHYWNINKVKSPLNQSFGISYSDIFPLFGEEIGLVSSLLYKSKFDNKKIRTIVWGGPGGENEIPDLDFEGYKSDWNVFGGAILNLSYKLGNHHKVSFKNSYSVNSDKETTQIGGYYYYHSQYEQRNELEFVSRELLSTQLVGEDFFPELLDLKLKWQGSYSQTKRDEPDSRKYVYAKDEINDPWRLKLTVSPSDYGARIFTNLNEYLRSLNFDFELPVNTTKIKFGTIYNTSNRFYNARHLSVVIPRGYLSGSLSQLYYLEPDSAFDINNFEYYSDIRYEEYFEGTHNYSSILENIGIYLMFEIPFNLWDQNFIFISGLRFEKYQLTLNTKTGFGINQTPMKINGDNSDKVFPSYNLIYKINENINLRFAYSQTINRPQLREVTPFGYFDFETMAIVRGNPDLKTANLDNYDIRFEYFPGINEYLSVSPFYKTIKNPIEQAVVPTSGNYEETFKNAAEAEVWGFEFESRYSLRVITDYLSYFFLNTNYSFIKTKVDDLLNKSRKSRPLQGQSPYVINVRLEYENPIWQSNISILYNRFGKRIIQAGIGEILEGDIYEDPKNIIDFIYKQTIISNLELKLSISNILDEDETYSQYNELQKLKEKHTSYSLGISYKL